MELNKTNKQKIKKIGQINKDHDKLNVFKSNQQVKEKFLFFITSVGHLESKKKNLQKIRRYEVLSFSLECQNVFLVRFKTKT